MLSDSIRQMRERMKQDGGAAGTLLALQAFEIEAKNMEERLHLLLGRPHVALDGNLISAPEPVIEISGSSTVKERSTRILLIVAPSKPECFSTAKAFELDMQHVGEMRFVSNPYHLRGWSRGTPFIALHRERWPENLDDALHALTVAGQLRIANEKDLKHLKERADAC
ncbi:hypothetical protein AM571_CH01414 [Rhizobium etli 8C-3]|uniref:Uncharacterized protein n=1 Tax=Rhizobium etli 8C-3 TaxID=538025 RepID=A0A1L5P264_RHIET|nr:hypothetical protein [Rhizobium etli]APO74249.1 hypothetical protein AM571_CH01414 [Rhizobium etli 8C-3]